MSPQLSLKIPEYAGDLLKPFRYKVFYGGRGGAKSWAFAITLLSIGMNRPIRVLCARELQVSIADSVHKLLSDIIGKHPGMAAFYEVQNKAIIGRNGTEFSFKGLKHNSTEIKSFEGVDYCWVEEAQAVSDKSWETLIPTVRKDNSEIWICFNPKNATDPTWQRFVLQADEDCLVRKVNWQDNPFFPDVLNKERLRLQRTDPEAYMHIWEGEFDTRYSGAVYAKLIAKAQEQGRISERVKYDPDFPVYSAWDLGYDDQTSIIFFQIGGGEVFVIDHYTANTEDIKHYCEVIHGREIIIDERDMATGEVLKWRFGDGEADHISQHRKAYHYHAHYGPHDAANKVQAAGGRSIIAQADKLGVKMFCIPATSMQNSIEAMRQTIPRMWLNNETCPDLLQSLMAYHYKYDEDKKIFSKEPVHDWSSHDCDAIEIMARVWQEKAADVKELNRREVINTFHRLRRENNLDKQDPYRTRSK